MTALPLNATTLRHHGRRLAIPTYDRAALTPAVVHLSVGAFHRSHQAVYFDDLAQFTGSTAWGLVGVGLHRTEMRDALTAQHGLYTVLTRDAERDEARVVGVIRRYLYAPADLPSVLASLADRRTRIVTLTITAAAYAADPEGVDPVSAIGFLVGALARRRRAGLPPFTVLSCDNAPGNGDLARRAVLAYACRRDPGLADWIEAEAAFPNSMVDRITPQTTEADRELLADRFGVVDRCPVVTEPFSQWILEDRFSDGRPPLDEVGVQFVGDVRPYALMKTRLLNASHCALGYLGVLAGHRRIDEAVGDPVFARAIERLMDDEVTPLLPPVPGIDVGRYKDTLHERFANPKIGDRLERLCRNGSAKMPQHVLSSLAEGRAQGRPTAMLTLAVAAWLRHLRGTDALGRPVLVVDPLAERLRRLALAGGEDPRPLLRESGLFGELAHDEDFAVAVTRALRAIDQDGVRGALALSHAAADGDDRDRVPA